MGGAQVPLRAVPPARVVVRGRSPRAAGDHWVAHCPACRLGPFVSDARSTGSKRAACRGLCSSALGTQHLAARQLHRSPRSWRHLNLGAAASDARGPVPRLDHDPGALWAR
eukprot:Amastigsp_a184272_6.p6 type:complete len:111 gc:universal Amastigsp_a184272_6:1435-1767(+)